MPQIDKIIQIEVVINADFTKDCVGLGQSGTIYVMKAGESEWLKLATSPTV